MKSLLLAFSVFRGDDSQRNSSTSQGGEIERARQRSLKFAPRSKQSQAFSRMSLGLPSFLVILVGSPLKQRVFNAIEHDEDAMQEDS